MGKFKYCSGGLKAEALPNFLRLCCFSSRAWINRKSFTGSTGLLLRSYVQFLCLMSSGKGSKPCRQIQAQALVALSDEHNEQNFAGLNSHWVHVRTSSTHQVHGHHSMKGPLFLTWACIFKWNESHSNSPNRPWARAGSSPGGRVHLI